MAQLFEPLKLRGITVRNRIAMSPMCMYSAGDDGRATDFHLMHLASRAMGGVGLIITEATAVEARGRISQTDLGLWDDAQVDPLARIVRLCQSLGARVCSQLAHAGRKAWTPQKGAGPLPAVGPSSIAFDTDWKAPQELSRTDLEALPATYQAAAQRALATGVDALELHAAHGYLLHEFLSPIANHRTDAYGGSLENRARLLLAIVERVRAVLPEDKPLVVRLSATDWVDGGLGIEDQICVAGWLGRRGVDAVDCSSGGISPFVPPVGPGYQIPFAERIRREAGIATMTVGLITTPETAEEIVRNGRADMVALGRQLLRDPYWPLRAARTLGHDLEWPRQYQRAKL
ncbi:MAG TPA: NADH:flavin oxidoreductase/NADH oxidase [Candidatus Sulfotelmatobacter sp.]|nr:NADH:flavin oxidoreductase/NADH oxidase [Candidatus Sulfotelmatobacter sp.]